MTDRKDDHTGEMPTVYTYSDGSQRVGKPPFPRLSPAEESARAGHDAGPGATPMKVPDGYKTAGEAAPSPTGYATADQFAARVEQKLRSDVLSGKDPNTPNQTTASDKPELAGQVNVDDNVQTVDPTDPKDLDKLTKGVKVKGATDEQERAAAVQIARETAGPVQVDKTKKAKK